MPSSERFLDRKNAHIFIVVTISLLAGVILSIQLPYAYYAEDSVFHSAKLLAAADNEYFTEAVTGYDIPYPSLFYVINGNAMRIFGLDTFQMDRLLQLFIFIGYFFAGGFFLASIFRDRRIAALGCLCLVFLLFAPTGKYFLIQNPSNFSIPFMLAGLGFMMKFYRRPLLRFGLIGALLIGIAVDIWWWNIVPAGGISTGMIYGFYKMRIMKIRLNRILACIGVFVLAVSYNLFALYCIRDSLGFHHSMLTRHSLANSQSMFDLARIWGITFLTKGNGQFSQYLVPEVLNNASTAFMLYGVAASLYFYLIVLPFNFIMAAFSCRETARRDDECWMLEVLLVASVVVLAASFVITFSFNISVIRRIQLYSYIFLLPGFLQFLRGLLFRDRWRRFGMILTCVAAVSILYTAVYSNEITISRPTSAETEEIVDQIENMPPRSGRIFMHYLDVNILARYARFRSFRIWPKRRFHVDKCHWDSLDLAYKSIIEFDSNWREWAEYYDTRYAILGKYEIHKFPIVMEPRDTAEGSMLAAFRDNSEVALENDEWIVFNLDRGVAYDSAETVPLSDELARTLEMRR